MYYTSTDAGAPQLSANAGSLIAILDACLVTGYGAKPAAGWTKAFTGNGLASYRQGGDSKGRYLYVNDSLGAVVRAAGYESMTGIGAGTGKFPHDTQMPGGGFLHKHDGGTDLGGIRAWVLVATPKAFWFVTQFSGNALWAQASASFFGDFKPFRKADDFTTMFIGAGNGVHEGNGESTSPQDAATHANFICRLDYLLKAHYAVRPWHGIGSSKQVGKHCDISRWHPNRHYQLYQSGYCTLGRGPEFVPLVNQTDGLLWLSPVYVHEPLAPRGELPGIAAHCALEAAMGNLDIIQGTGAFAGRSFVFVKVWYGSIFLDTSDAW